MKLPANSHIKLLKVSPCSATQLHRLLSSGKNEKESNLVHVYKGSLTKQIKSVKVFSLSTSIAGLAGELLLILFIILLKSNFHFSSTNFSQSSHSDGRRHWNHHCRLWIRWFLHICHATSSAFGYQEIRNRNFI